MYQNLINKLKTILKYISPLIVRKTKKMLPSLDVQIHNRWNRIEMQKRWQQMVTMQFCDCDSDIVNISLCDLPFTLPHLKSVWLLTTNFITSLPISFHFYNWYLCLKTWGEMLQARVRISGYSERKVALLENKRCNGKVQLISFWEELLYGSIRYL